MSSTSLSIISLKHLLHIFLDYFNIESVDLFCEYYYGYRSAFKRGNLGLISASKYLNKYFIGLAQFLVKVP